MPVFHGSKMNNSYCYLSHFPLQNALFARQSVTTLTGGLTIHFFYKNRRRWNEAQILLAIRGFQPQIILKLFLMFLSL